MSSIKNAFCNAGVHAGFLPADAHLESCHQIFFIQLAACCPTQQRDLSVQLQAFPVRGRQRLGHKPHLVARRHLRSVVASVYQGQPFSTIVLLAWPSTSCAKGARGSV